MAVGKTCNVIVTTAVTAVSFVVVLAIGSSAFASSGSSPLTLTSADGSTYVFSQIGSGGENLSRSGFR